ncbi:MAG: membrane protein insertase YidC [Planctomycetes bacterium]|nr:membrane protein insertase YidC [Planctomycetota bacterium]
MKETDPKQRFILMLAMGLTFFVILQYLMPIPEVPPTVTQMDEPAERQTRQTSAAAAPAVDTSGAPVAVGEFNPEVDYRVSVKVGREGRNERGYQATFSTIGAGLMQYRLLGHYRVPNDYSPENQVIILDHLAPGRDSLRIDQLTSGPSGSELRTLGLRAAKFELMEYPAGAVVEPAPGEDIREGENLVFRAVIGDWEIFKTFSFPREGEADFTIFLDVEFRNISDSSRVLVYRLAGPSGMLADDDSPNFGQINFLTARQPSPASVDVEIEREAISKLVSVKNMFDQDNRANLAWLGSKNRFFAALMTADRSQIADSNGVRRQLFGGDWDLMPTAKDILDNLKNQPQVTMERGAVPAFEDVLLAVAPGVVQSGETHQASYQLYAGPAVDEIMEQSDPRLHGVVSYTISYFDFISRLLVRLLTFLDGILGNYGLAIIAVTIIIKLLLHPLNRKSFVSMNKMSKLAPMMKEIQAKYANDKMKMQQEMSKFYKENGVSMAGSCLPVFLQLPIFFSLYGAFSQGFSMRHAAFIPGWINDLSKPDSVYDLGFNIPLLNSSHISILPIIYLGLQLVQMSQQPKPADPQQAQQQRIMKIMPIMFVFIFYSMPAGLVLYFTISALAGVAENWWMRKFLLPRLGLGNTPEAAQTAANNAKAGAGAAHVPSEAKKKKKKK